MITNRCRTILKWTKGEESNMRVELCPTKSSSEVHSKVAFYEAVANICKIKWHVYILVYYCSILVNMWWKLSLESEKHEYLGKFTCIPTI